MFIKYMYFLNIQIYFKSKFAERINFYSITILKNFHAALFIAHFTLRSFFQSMPMIHDKIVHILSNIRFTVLLQKDIRAVYKFVIRDYI